MPREIKITEPVDSYKQNIFDPMPLIVVGIIILVIFYLKSNCLI